MVILIVRVEHDGADAKEIQLGSRLLSIIITDSIVKAIKARCCYHLPKIKLRLQAKLTL